MDNRHSINQLDITEFLALWDTIENIELLESQADSITWLHTPDGNYSAKSAYKLQFEGVTKSKTAQTVRGTKALPKCKDFLWLMLQNRIWTAARLQLRGWPNEGRMWQPGSEHQHSCLATEMTTQP